MAPSDPIRVTRAVRQCEHWTHDLPPNNSANCTWGCSGGWVDVPVMDDQCYACQGGSQAWRHPCGPRDCPRCGGSGRRLHNWATGWCVGDEVLTDEPDESGVICSLHRPDSLWGWSAGLADTPLQRDHVVGPYRIAITNLTLVLSDPSHRPEPMRWKQ